MIQSADTQKSGRLVLLAVMLFAIPLGAAANLIGGSIGGLGTELDLKFNPTDLTGVRVKNLSELDGDVQIELLNGPSNFGLPLPDGFVLLDNTLKVTSNLQPGGRRIRIRMDLGRYGGRANIRRQGIRFNSLRLLRADFRRGREGRWIRAIDTIRDKRRADIRFLTGVRADFELGHYGIDTQNNFVWAVLDTSGRAANDPDSFGEQFFALAGLRAVPIPAALFLFITGCGLLALVARRPRTGAT